MPGHQSTETSNARNERRQRASAALALAYEIRKELMNQSPPPPDPRDEPIFRLVQNLKSASAPPGGGRGTAVHICPGVEPEVHEQSTTVSAEELRRLQRIVNLLTTAMGELNLWLANAGRAPVEVE